MRVSKDKILRLVWGYKGKELLKLSFSEWFKIFFKQVNGCEFVADPLHTEKLLPTFDDIADNKIRRANICMPPRSGKTTLLIYLMAHTIAHGRPFNFIYTSYSGDLLARCAAELRNVINSDIFQLCYGKQTIDEINELETTTSKGDTVLTITRNSNRDKFTRKQFIFGNKSSIQFSSAGGTITGLGAGTIHSDEYFTGAVIVDDPNKPADAFSMIKQQRVKDWFDNTVKSRTNGLRPKDDNDLKGTIIVVQQRTSPDDLSGYIQKIYAKYYHFVICKLIKDDGTLTLPSFYNKASLEEVQASKIVFETQYQQNPDAVNDNLIFDLSNFIKVANDYSQTLTIKHTFITTDLSQKDEPGKDNDYTCLCYWIIDENNNLVLGDMFYKKLALSVDRVELVNNFYMKHAASNPPIFIEKGNNNEWSAELLTRRFGISSRKVRVVGRTGDIDVKDHTTYFRGTKEIRFLNASQHIGRFGVYIPERFYTDIKEEVIRLTMLTVNKVHDDFCDNLADATVIARLGTC